MTTLKLSMERGNFAKMIASFSISRMGITAFNIMVLWITLRLTGSPIIAGFADGLFSVPLFFSFIVGALIDRSPHKKIIAIMSTVGRSGSVMLLLLASFSNSLGIIVFLAYLSVVFVGFASDIANAVRSVWFKLFLKEEEYQKGSSLMNGVGSIAEASGYVLSGVFLFIGITQGIMFLALVFIASSVPLIMIRYRETGVPRNSVSQGLKDGLKFLKESRFFQEALFLVLIADLALAMIGIAFTVLIQRVFVIPAIYLSFVFIVLSVGIALGSVPGAKLKGRLGIIEVPLLFMVGVMFASEAFISAIYLLYIPVLAMGIMIGMINPPVESVIYRKIPSEIMARIMGLMNTLALSMTFISGAIGGAIIEFSSARILFVVIGALIVVSALMIIGLREFFNAEVV
jgi:DHA3 family macrolide efflux protein-like MFS transporter